MWAALKLWEVGLGGECLKGEKSSAIKGSEIDTKKQKPRLQQFALWSPKLHGQLFLRVELAFPATDFSDQSSPFWLFFISGKARHGGLRRPCGLRSTKIIQTFGAGEGLSSPFQSSICLVPFSYHSFGNCFQVWENCGQTSKNPTLPKQIPSIRINRKGKVFKSYTYHVEILSMTQLDFSYSIHVIWFE